MTMKITLIAALLASSTLVGASFAQGFDKEKVCAEQKAGNTKALEAARAARPDAAAVKAAIAAAAGIVPGNNICIADMLTEADADIAEALAELADSGDIETAAGPDGDAPQDFTGDDAPAGENPSQLNTPVTAPAASPAVPAAS